jgi:hypothetical protein
LKDLCEVLKLQAFQKPQQAMRKIKLSGREMSVIRSIDLAEGTTGQEIHNRTQIPLEDLADVLSGLMDAGFVETIPPTPPSENLKADAVAETVFETNPAYNTELRTATRR